MDRMQFKEHKIGFLNYYLLIIPGICNGKNSLMK